MRLSRRSWAAGRPTQVDDRLMNDEVERQAKARILADRGFTEGRTNYFVVGPRCFEPDQIRALRAIIDERSEPAQVVEAGKEYAEGAHRDEARRTRVRTVEPELYPWVYARVREVFTLANQLMRADIVPSMNDPIQLLRYDAEEQGHFRWHADTVPSDMTRKISLVVPLSEPEEYEGGQLQFNQGGLLCELPQKCGHPVAFPSWLIHRVQPVTRGRRYSLVAWIRGPNWR